MAKGRRATKHQQLRRDRADGSKKAVVRKTASKRKGQETTPISKTLTATKRSAAAKKVVVTKELSDLQRTAAQKWAWVERQLKRA